MKRIVLGVLLATLALYTWGFVTWALMPVNPFSQADDAVAAEALRSALPASGTYLVPGDPSDMEAFTAKHLEGPVAMVHIQREGLNPMAPSVFILGILHMLVTVALIAFVLHRVGPSLRSYGDRVGFVAVLGLAAAFWSTLAKPIWWHHPWGFHLVDFGYSAIGWLIVGLILARFVVAQRTDGQPAYA